MKKIDLFDTFENAEDELMEDFTDMSPEISDEKLDKLLAVSERNYEKKKAEIERTRKADNTDDENMVRGVERVKRPVWLRPAAMAASFVLIAGTVIGSIVLFNRDKSKKHLFNSDDLSNTDNGALPDVYTDKEALIELCSNATKHYDKIEATYVHEFSNSDYIRTTNTKLEYDVKGNYLFADEKERQDSLKGLYSTFDSRFVSYFYNNKGVHINNEETFEVSTYEDDWYKENVYIVCEDFYDPKYIFSTEPDSYIRSERIKRSDTWSITGKDTVCGRKCVVVETEHEYGKETEYIDAETGVELKYVYDGNYDDEKAKFEVTDINYNDEAHVTSPLEFRQRIEENGYESFVSIAVDGNGNRVDPAVVNNLDFLSLPDEESVAEASTDVIKEKKQPNALNTSDIDVDYVIDLCASAAEHYERAYIVNKEERITKESGGRFIQEKTVQYDTKNKTIWADTQETSLGGYDEEETKRHIVSFWYKDRSVELRPEDGNYNIADTSENTRMFYRYSAALELSPELLVDEMRAAKDSISIKGRDTVCGRECIVITFDNSIPTSDMYIDIETGIVLKSTADLGSIYYELQTLEIRFDDEAGEFITPAEFKKQIEDNGYKLNKKYKADGMAAMETDDPLDLNFLDIPLVR